MRPMFLTTAAEPGGRSCASCFATDGQFDATWHWFVRTGALVLGRKTRIHAVLVPETALDGSGTEAVVIAAAIDGTTVRIAGALSDIAKIESIRLPGNLVLLPSWVVVPTPASVCRLADELLPQWSIVPCPGSVRKCAITRRTYNHQEKSSAWPRKHRVAPCRAMTDDNDKSRGHRARIPRKHIVSVPPSWRCGNRC